MLWIILPIAAALVFYRLYQSGLMLLSCKSALTFVGKDRGLSASFTGCNGYIKRILRYPSSRSCVFTLTQHLTAGCMQVEIYGAQKKLLLTLDESHPSGAFLAEANARYTLVFRFHKASGSYELTPN